MSKLTKSLPHFGWEPIVLAEAAGHFGSYDSTSRAHSPDLRVVRARDPNPLKRLATLVKSGAREQPSRRSSFRTFLTSRLRSLYRILMPDRDWLWRYPALRAGREILSQEPVDALFSTAPYITNHLVALELQRETGLPWIAEFRDIWAHFDGFPRPDLWQRWRLRREREICLGCDHLVCVSAEYLADFKRHYDLPRGGSTVIYNGFEASDFAFLKAAAPNVFPKFSIAHAGFWYRGERSPQPLLNALTSLSRSGEIDLQKVSLDFFGPYDAEVDRMVFEAGLTDNTVWHGSFSYHDLLPLLAQAYCTLLITHTRSGPRLPAKLFDYMGMQRPIIAIAAPDSEVPRILAETGTGFSAGHAESDKLGRIIKDLWGRWSTGDPGWVNAPEQKLKPYMSSEQARALAHILNAEVQKRTRPDGESRA